MSWRSKSRIIVLLIFFSSLIAAQAQTTYYLHGGTLFSPASLSTGGPSANSKTFSSQNLSGLAAPADYLIQTFPTGSGVPGVTGYIASGSTVTYNLYMNSSASQTTLYPEAELYLDSTSGTPFCNATGTTALTTTVTEFTLSCTTTSTITVSSTDILYLWVGVHISTTQNTSVQGQLTVDGSDGSNVIVPAFSGPTITSLSIYSGSPGTQVTITGSNFGSSQSASNGTVTFDSRSAGTASTWNTTTITVNVPVTNTGNLLVTANGLSSPGINFTIPPPVISNFTPLQGRPGDSITISGSNFGQQQFSGSGVSFGGAAATITTWSNSQVVATVPSGISNTVSIQLTAGLQPTTAATQFTVIPPPNITSISPTSGPVNTLVTISGSGFGSPKGTSTVTFNNGITGSPTSWGDSQIQVPVPVGATSGYIVISAGSETSTNNSNDLFTVTGAPTINSNGVNPVSGPTGTVVTITGSNFGATQGTSIVEFGGVSSTSTTSWATGTIKVAVPSNAPVAADSVTVTVSGQTVTAAQTFTVTNTATLTGTVTNAVGGAAISGATVQVLQNGVSKGSTTTNGSGTYTFSSITAGVYDIQASATSFGTALLNVVSIPAGQTTTKNFSLGAAGGVIGLVKDATSGSPISGATVTAYVGSAAVAATTTNGNTGQNYTLAGLNAGSYLVLVTATNYVTQSFSGTPVTAGSNVTRNFSLKGPGSGTITYAYDELGRVVGVTDSSGDAVVYQYDAVGNVTFISRHNSTGISIVNFFPSSGPIGTAVTINGTGFNTTPSNDTVTFYNGHTATVTSATATQLTVTVPSGASTGTISVSTPTNGSTTSATNFTVTTSAAPTVANINGTNPTIVTEGTAITINGTNFDTNTNNDFVHVNTTSTIVSSAAATSIATTAPSTVGTGSPGGYPSGNAKVATLNGESPNGTTQANVDLYVPWGTHVGTDVGFTQRLVLPGNPNLGVYASSATVNIPQGKIGLVLFDATAGQSVSMNLQVNSGFGSACNIYVFNPRGDQIKSTPCTGDNGYGQIVNPPVPLPLDGTYTIGVDPGASTGGGNITLTLYNATTLTANATIDGPPVTITTTAIGQQARFYFPATPNQRVIISVTGSYPNFNCSPASGLYDFPGSRFLQGTNGSGYIDTTALSTGGTYQIWFHISGANCYAYGTQTVQIKSVPPDFVGSSITASFNTNQFPNPASVSYTIAPGQNAYWPITVGTQYQKIFVTVTMTTSSPSCGYAGLFATNSSPYAGLFIVPVSSTNSTVNLNSNSEDTYTLSNTTPGYYVIGIQHCNEAAGTISFGFYDVSDYQGAVGLASPAEMVPPSTALTYGMDALLSITGNALVPGQTIGIAFTNSFALQGYTFANCNAQVSDAYGVNQGAITPCGVGQVPVFNSVTMSSNSTAPYGMVIDPQGLSAGQTTIQLFINLVVNGPAYTFETPGHSLNFFYTNSSGNSATVHWSGGTFTNCTMTVTGPFPSTTVIASSSCNGASGSLSVPSGSSGNYLIQAGSAGPTGGMSISVTQP